MSYPPTYQMLVDDLRKGIIHLNFKLFKPSGKYAYGGFATCHLMDLKAVQFSETGNFIRLLANNQKEVVPSAFEDYTVVVTEDHYDQVESYTHFFTRLVPPLKSSQ